MMRDATRFYLTTAIDYPNSRPHIGTAFEKIGADVQARFRRMEGYAVHFLMGNDENTIKVSQRAEELGIEPKPYVDDMARQFREVWAALEISFDDFIQTSEPRHHVGCQKFIQAVYDAGRHLQEGLHGPLLHRLRGVQDREGAGRRPLPEPPEHAAPRGRGGELLLPALGLRRPTAGALRGEPRVHPAREPAERDPQPGRVGPAGRLDHPQGVHLGHPGPVRPRADDLRLVRRAA